MNPLSDYLNVFLYVNFYYYYIYIYIIVKMGAEDGSRVASSGKTLQFSYVLFVFLVVLRVRFC